MPLFWPFVLLLGFVGVRNITEVHKIRNTSNNTPHTHQRDIPPPKIQQPDFPLGLETVRQIGRGIGDRGKEGEGD